MATLIQNFLRWFPFVTVGWTVSCLLISVVVSKLSEHHYGGLPWPYVSDTGSRPPEYVIFAIGLTVAGAFLIFLHVSHGMAGLSIKYGNVALIWVESVLGALSALGLAGLGIFDTNNYADIHLYCALFFFVLAQIWMVLDCITYFRWSKKDPDSKYFSTNSKLKFCALIPEILCFIVYIPIGLTWVMVDCEWVQNPDGTYDYSNCVGQHTMRTISQWLCIFFIVCYMGTMRLDLRYNVNRSGPLL